MINGDQIRAARALLDWDRERLALESGVSVAQIAKIETGETKSPRVGTLTSIESAFAVNGVAFKDGGVVPRQEIIITFQGDGWFLNLLDDVYKTLVDSANPELLAEFIDERKSDKETIGRIRKIRNAGIKMRMLTEENNTHLMASLNEYRCVASKYFVNENIIIYGDRVAICTDNNSKAVVIKDALVARAFKNSFEIMWDSLKKPEKTTAHERY